LYHHLHSFPTRRSSDLLTLLFAYPQLKAAEAVLCRVFVAERDRRVPFTLGERREHPAVEGKNVVFVGQKPAEHIKGDFLPWDQRSEEHTSELQSLAYLV